MSTRRAAPGSEFAPERFASSAAFERGLLGSLVARRCTKLEDPKNKELIWFIHFISHQPGGLKALALALPANYPEHFGTPEMVKLGKRSGNYNTEQVRKIRGELPGFERQAFLLRGETLATVNLDAKNDRRLSRQAAIARANMKMSDANRDYGASDSNCEEIRRREMAVFEREESELKEAAEKNPNSYAVADFLSICSQASANNLEEQIQELCLNPECAPSTLRPWYFAGLVDALRDHFKQWIAERREGLVITEIGKQIEETLDYAAYSRIMQLIEGAARTGKSFAARSWCELHPGQARFIEVPPGNDESSFFRALARGLGIGNYAQYKAIEMRERVESVLLTGDLMIVLDEAWRLWPQQRETRFGYPRRINWLMSMTNQGVPICLVSTPQFLTMLKEAEDKGGWNSAQFQGRLGPYKQLPQELSKQDLVNVAAALLPEADDETLRAIASYARSSASYIAAIEKISTRARYLASRSGRDSAAAEDVRRAMQESVIPSDSKLVSVMESKRPKQRLPRLAPAAAAELQEQSEEVPVPRHAGSRAELRSGIVDRRAQSLNPQLLEPAP